MQKRAGILFLSKNSSKILLLLEESKWAVPTFIRHGTVIEDAESIIQSFYKDSSKLIPLELYVSNDHGFEFSTYVCLVNSEFSVKESPTYCWADLDHLPKNLHQGLKTTLNNKLIQDKIKTMIIVAQQL